MTILSFVISNSADRVNKTSDAQNILFPRNAQDSSQRVPFAPLKDSVFPAPIKVVPQYS